MAIAEMKKVSLLALNRDKPRLMAKMQQLGCVQVIESEQPASGEQSEREQARLSVLNKQIDRLDLAIRRLSPFDKNKPGMLDPRRTAGSDQVQSCLANRGEIMAVVDRTEAIERTRGELKAQEARLNASIEQILPWDGLTVPLDQLGDTKTSTLFLATVPTRRIDAFMDAFKTLGAAQYEEVSRSGESTQMLIAAHKSILTDLDHLMKDTESARVPLSDMEGTASLQLEQLRAKLARIAEVREQLTREVIDLADQLPVLRVLRDAQSLERDQLQSALRTENTRSAFLLTGWVPENRAEALTNQIKSAAPDVEIEFSDPAEGEKPPTLMRNRSIVAPFESIVKLFSLPDPAGVDPTFVMTPFWVCFFGMMVSDAGYGIVLGLAAAYLYKKLGRKSGMGNMAFVLALGGLSTVFWGAMYGGWFSIEGIPPLLFSPMEEPLSMVVLCMGIGVVHIFAGMGMAAYLNFKRGKPLDALFDQFSWMLLLIGLGLLMVNQTLGMIVAGAGFLIILLFAGRSEKNPIKRVISGLGSLYGISGFVSDILSYVRLFGMGLATGVIGMVFNTLALMMWGSVPGCIGAVLILIVGHTFNLGINALGAYVHSCRLQFIEFFGKFYESGGRNFMPLSQRTRYVDIEPQND